MQRSNEQGGGRPAKRAEASADGARGGRGRGQSSTDGRGRGRGRGRGAWSSRRQQASRGGGRSNGSEHDAAGSLSRSSTGWQHSSGDVAYKDSVFLPTQRRILRSALDAASVAAAEHPWSSCQRVNKVASLSRIATRVVAENLHNPALLDDLSEGMLPANLLSTVLRIAKRVYANDQELPFFVWKRLTQTYSAEVPASFKSYRGIVFDDVDALQNLHLFDASFSFTPCYDIITLLDVSDCTFTREDVYRIRLLLAKNLAALRLDNILNIDDDALKGLARGAGDENAFSKLEILSLKGCIRVTDVVAPKLAGFPSLRVIDLRGTSCTSAFKAILRQYIRPPFISPSSPLQLPIFGEISLDEQLHLLRKVSQAPFGSPGTALPGLPDSAIPAAVVITSVTRLNDSQSEDPRDARSENPFHANHHVFGNVFTTRPINSANLRDSGQEAISAGEAFRSGTHEAVMTGQLQMAQADRSWRRCPTGALRKETAPTSCWSGQDLDKDCSDLEAPDNGKEDDTDDASDPPTPPRLSRFYGCPAEPPRPLQATTVLPQRDDLMLLRFCGDQNAQHAAAPGDVEALHSSIAKRKVPLNENDQVGVKKKKGLAGGLPFLEMMGGTNPTKAPLRQIVRESQQPVSQTSVSSTASVARPAGIVKNPTFTKAVYFKRNFS